MILLKRVYDEASPNDGFRVLVDRLWPRGLSKERARVDAWLREIAPSTDLRKWFHSHPDSWQDFRRRYLAELRAASANEQLQEFYGILDENAVVTLLFASKETQQNNATVLKELVEGMRKPPQGTGARRARVQRRKRSDA
jgi:uncharacterized protein YeaO (DUF488 family)